MITIKLLAQHLKVVVAIHLSPDDSRNIATDESVKRAFQIANIRPSVHEG